MWCWIKTGCHFYEDSRELLESGKHNDENFAERKKIAGQFCLEIRVSHTLQSVRNFLQTNIQRKKFA